MNHLLANFFKSVALPIFAVFACIWSAQNGLVILSDWQQLLEQAPMLLFIGAIIVALRFKQSRVVYSLLFLLLSWALLAQVGNFTHFNLSPSLWFISQLLVLTVFSLDQNKTLLGRHGLIRALGLLTVVLINYRFKQSITIHQWIETQYLEFLPSVSSIGQIELLFALLALFIIMFRQISRPSNTTLATWEIGRASCRERVCMFV